MNEKDEKRTRKKNKNNNKNNNKNKNNIQLFWQTTTSVAGDVVVRIVLLAACHGGVGISRLARRAADQDSTFLIIFLHQQVALWREKVM